MFASECKLLAHGIQPFEKVILIRSHFFFESLVGAAVCGITMIALSFVLDRRFRFPAVAVGLVIIVLSDSRAGWLGLGGGCLAVLIVALWTGRRVPPVNPSRLGILVGLVLLSMIAIVGTSLGRPDARPEVWGSFIQIAQEPSIFGNRAAISDLITVGDLPGWAWHGHNLFLDALIRYGVVGTLVLIALVVGSLLLVVRSAARGGSAFPMLVVVGIVVASQFDLVLSWMIWTPTMSVLVLALLYASAEMGGSTDAAPDKPVPRLDTKRS